MDALKLVLTKRKVPSSDDDAGIVFLTRTRRRWIRTRKREMLEKYLHLNAISPAFGKVLNLLDSNSRDGLNFYTLRRRFEIVGGESKDQVAVDAIMGHADDSMAAVYRQGVISDERLQAVVNNVRAWLWPSTAKGGVV